MSTTGDRMTIGTCSICGGRVSVHTGPWLGIIPPTPSCESCGAVPAENHGPVIPMRPLGQWTTDGTGGNRRPFIGTPYASLELGEAQMCGESTEDSFTARITIPVTIRKTKP